MILGIILIIVIIALLILMRFANGGAEPSKSTFMIADNLLK